MGSQSRKTRKGCSPKCSTPKVVKAMAQPRIQASPMPPRAKPALSFLLRLAHSTISTNAGKRQEGQDRNRLKIAGDSDMDDLFSYPFIVSISSTFTVFRCR